MDETGGILEGIGEIGMSMLWVDGFGTNDPQPIPRRQGVPPETSTEIRDLRAQVERLTLLNQALWEIIRERLQLTDADLEQHAEVIDLRDGIADGKMTATPVRCPTCSRVCNSRHAKCLYCGQLFQKPLFG